MEAVERDEAAEREPLPPYLSNDANSSRKPILFRYFMNIVWSIILSTGLVVVSFIMGSTSMLPEMITIPPDSKYTSLDLKWLASGPLIVGIGGNFFGYYFSSRWGPRFLFRWMHPLLLMLYLIMAIHPSLYVMYFTRFGLGFVVGVFDVIIYSLIPELCDPKVRGFASAIPDLLVSSTLLWFYISIPKLSGKIVTLCNIIPLSIGFFGSFFVPESPYWLVKNTREFEQQKVFMSSKDEDSLKIFIENKVGKSNTCKQMQLMREGRNWKPVLLVAMIFLLRELSGNSAINFYVLFLFQHAYLSLDAVTCTALALSVRLLGSLGSSVCHDKFGRRNLSMFAFSISGLSLLVGGVFMLKWTYHISWIPLASVIIFTAMNGIGSGPIPWILLGELMPLSIRLSGSGIVTTVIYISQFLVVCSVPLFIDLIDIGPTFIFFGFGNICTTLILWKFLPETKGVSLVEIEKFFKDPDVEV